MRSFLLGLALAALGLVDSVAARDQYFPAGVWGPLKSYNGTAVEQDEFYESWFGGNLAKLHEGPLWSERARSKAPFALRMSFHRGAEIPDTDAMRLSIDAAGNMFYVFSGFKLREVDEPPGPGEDKTLKPVRRTGKVDPEFARAIMALVEEIAPFTSKIPSQEPEVEGLDGTVTLFEFSGDGMYNAMARWELDGKNGGALGRLEALIFDAMPKL